MFILVAAKSGGGIIIASICFALSLGIYQAYIPLAISLYLLVLIRKGFSASDLSGILCFKMGIRYFISLCLGFLLYYGLLQIFLVYFNETLSNYQGVDQMGIKLYEIPEMLKRIYEKFFTLSFRAQYSVNLTKITRKAFLFSQVVSLVLFGYLEGRIRVSVNVKIWNAVFFILFPVGVNGIIFMCFHSYIYSLMVYGVVMVFAQPVVLLELVRQRAGNEMNQHILGKLTIKCTAALTVAIFLITALNYVWQANGNYVALYYANRQTENYFAGLVERIKAVEGYQAGLPLAVIGDNFADAKSLQFRYKDITAFSYGGNPTSEGLINAYSRDNWLNLYLGFSHERVSQEDCVKLGEKEFVREMPCYPQDGSVQIIDGVIILKITNE